MLHTFTMRLSSGPLLVPLAPPDAVANQHVAVGALVRDQGVVGHRSVDGASVFRIFRDFALNR